MLRAWSACEQRPSQVTVLGEPARVGDAVRAHVHNELLPVPPNRGHPACECATIRESRQLSHNVMTALENKDRQAHNTPSGCEGHALVDGQR